MSLRGRREADAVRVAYVADLPQSGFCTQRVLAALFRRRLRAATEDLRYYSPVPTAATCDDTRASADMSSLLVDASDFGAVAVAGSWPFSALNGEHLHADVQSRRLWVAAHAVALQRRLPIMWAAATLPSPLTRRAEHLLALIVKHAQQFAVTDEASMDILSRAGARRPIHLVSDPMTQIAKLWTPGELSDALTTAFIAMNRRIPQRMITLDVSAARVTKDIQLVAETGDVVARALGATAVLVPFGGGLDGQRTARQVGRAMRTNPVVLQRPSLRAVGSILANSDLHIGPSADAFIASWAFGTRAVAIANSASDRLREFARSAGCEASLCGGWEEVERRVREIRYRDPEPDFAFRRRVESGWSEYWGAVTRSLGSREIRGPDVAGRKGMDPSVATLIVELLDLELEDAAPSRRGATEAARAPVEHQQEAKRAKEASPPPAKRSPPRGNPPARQASDAQRVRDELGAAEKDLGRTAASTSWRIGSTVMEIYSRGRTAQRVAPSRRIDDAREQVRRALDAVDAQQTTQAAEQIREARRLAEDALASPAWRIGHALAHLGYRLRGRRPVHGQGALDAAVLDLDRAMDLLSTEERAAAPSQPQSSSSSGAGAGARTRLNRRRRRGIGNRSGQTRVSVVAWDVSHNPLGRAHILADLLRHRYEVEVRGAHFPAYGKAVWEPYRREELPILKFAGRDLPRHWGSMEKVARSMSASLVLASKPRMPSLALAALAAKANSSPLMLDVDDLEIAFFGASRGLALAEADRRRSRSDFLRPYGELWTRVCHELAPTVQPRTVANSSLRDLFGGTIVPHARDEAVFDPARYDRRQTRRSMGIEDADRLVMFAGTARSHKGVELLVDALVELGDAHYKLCLIGPPSAPIDYARQQLGERLRVLERVGWRQLPATLVAADLVCLLQDQESEVARYQTPAKLTDALALEIPILATQTGPLHDLAERGLVHKVDREHVADELHAAFVDYDRIKSRAIENRKFFLNEFSYSVVRPSVEGVVEQAMANPPELPPPLEELVEYGRRRFYGPPRGFGAVRGRVPRTASPALDPPNTARESNAARQYDVIFFWKQNDSDIYGRRSDMMAKYLARSQRVRQVIHLDSPLSVEELLAWPRLSGRRHDQGNLVFDQTLRRAFGAANFGGFTKSTFLHAPPPRRALSGPRRAIGRTVARRLPARASYGAYLEALLSERGIGPIPTIMWTCPPVPEFATCYEVIQPSVLVADIIDDNRAWHAPESRRWLEIHRAYEENLEVADVAVTSSTAVAELMASFADPVHVVAHGCDVESPSPAQAASAALQGLPRPIIGYVGNLASRLDLQMLHEVIRLRPGWSFVFAGSAHLSDEAFALDVYPNVRFLGVQPYAQSIGLIKAFDVGMVPHVDNVLTRSMSPLKVSVYLTHGLPVVYKGPSTLGPFESAVAVAEEAHGFVTAIEAALAGAHPGAAIDGRFIAEHSWARRVDSVLDLADAVMARSVSRAPALAG